MNKLTSLVLVSFACVAVWLVAANASNSAADAMPLMSEARFTEIRETLKRIKYPISRSAFLKELGGEQNIRWVFDSTYGKGRDVRYRSYFATEPYIPGAGSFCVETELGKEGIEPTDEIVRARLCFVSRFGVTFYEERER